MSYCKVPIKDVTIDRELLNRAHVEYPQPGDYWHEMFCPYFVILEVVDDHVVICEKTKQHSDSWSFDLSECKVISRVELEKQVKYSTMDKFVADVVPYRLSSLVQDFKERLFVDGDVKIIPKGNKDNE